MGIIELLKKVGLLRYGSESGTGPLTDFYGAAKKSGKQTAETGDDHPASTSLTADSAAIPLPHAPAGPATGRVVAFGLTVATAILAAVIFLLGIGFNLGFVLLVLLWVFLLWFAKRFAFNGRASWLSFTGLFVTVLFFDFMIMGITAPNGETVPETGIETSSNPPSALSIEQVRFAKPGSNGELEPVDSATFKRGEEVHLVLIRVAGFQSGPDGRHWYDLDASLTGPDGQIVVEGTDILGEAGHRALPEGVAKAPEAQFKMTASSPVGTYGVALTIKDKITGNSKTVTRAFKLL